MRASLVLIVLSVCALTLSSCNTFIGMGRDLQSLGAGMQKSAYRKSEAPAAPTAPVEQAAPAPRSGQ